MRRLDDLQICNVLHLVGEGRAVIGEMFRRLDTRPTHAAILAHPAEQSRQRSIAQTLQYSGEPRTVARLTSCPGPQARPAAAVIVMACAVGDTVVGDAVSLRRSWRPAAPRGAPRRSIEVASERTFEQDPKYPIRLVVDIAIKALSPAINDPTTAVQAIDQIEDLLRRLGRRDLDAGASGMSRAPCGWSSPPPPGRTT